MRRRAAATCIAILAGLAGLLPIYDLRLFHASGKKETLNCKNYVMFAILLKYLEVVRHSDSASRVFAIVSVVVVSIQNHSSIPTLSINQSYLVA